MSGFGRSSFADGYVFQPETLDAMREVLALARHAGRQVTLRGAGRSYGDASIGAECVVLDLSRLRRVLSFDSASGIIEVEPGVTIEDLWRHALPQGWWPPVVSGTAKVTLGGALAMNIHGKNNLARGTLGEHVLELDFETPDGRAGTLTPSDPAFFSVISGLGLLGAITRIKLQLKPVASGEVRVEAASCRNWGEQFAAFERYEGDAEYVVSWIDCFGSGASEGRGLLHAGWHSEEPDSASLQPERQDLPEKVMALFPKASVWRILKQFNHRPGMKLINAAKQIAGRREHGKTVRQSLAAFNFLLDYVPDWELAYRPGGLIQCQYFIPREQAKSTFSKLVRMQQEAGLESFLAVMKRHRPDRFLLSHAVDGYSLALDFKVTRANQPALFDLARRMNDVALEANGRFYFAKDSTLTPEQARAFLGAALKEFQALKRELDPENMLTSELVRRLKLFEA
jgi:decaprenylphospho-beta-D-ribofuranose 2-oxidase